MSIDPKVNMTENVMFSIRQGKSKMKSKWYFVSGSIALALGLIGLIILAVFSVSVMSFSLRSHGPMGAIRYEQLLSTFPIGALFVAVIGIGFGSLLLRKYDFSYKKNFIAIIAGFMGVILLAGWFIDYSGLDRMWMHRGSMRPFYESYQGNTLPQGSVFHMMQNR
jgi:hypothetical protein